MAKQAILTMGGQWVIIEDDADHIIEGLATYAQYQAAGREEAIEWWNLYERRAREERNRANVLEAHLRELTEAVMGAMMALDYETIKRERLALEAARDILKS